MAKKNRYMMRVALVGSAAVGKTTIVQCLHNLPIDKVEVTIGVQFTLRKKMLPSSSGGGGKLHVQYWDTAGAEVYADLTSTYFRGAHAIILVYSLADPRTWDDIVTRWWPCIERYGKRDAADNVRARILLVGNKRDLLVAGGAGRPIDPDVVDAWAKAHGIWRTMECSAYQWSVEEEVVIFDELEAAVTTHYGLATLLVPPREKPGAPPRLYGTAAVAQQQAPDTACC